MEALDLIKECNVNITISKKTVNRFFYRNDQQTIGDIKIKQRKGK